MKSKTLKWLQAHIDEIDNNMLSMKIEEEDTKENEKIKNEILKCIDWVESK